jgi:hypothetical protein
MARRFYYPAWRRKLEALANYQHKHMADMIDLNEISGTELTQLQTLDADLQTIIKNPAFPKYRQAP